MSLRNCSVIVLRMNCASTWLAMPLILATIIFSMHQVKIAIIGITAGGVGLDFSSAQNVVFLELPQSPSLMLQVCLLILLLNIGKRNYFHQNHFYIPVFGKCYFLKNK